MSLTERELECMRFAANGEKDDAIASALGVSVATVRTYWERIFKKLGCRSRTHAVALLIRADCEEKLEKLRQEQSSPTEP